MGSPGHQILKPRPPADNAPRDDTTGTSHRPLDSSTEPANATRQIKAGGSQIGQSKFGLICMGNQQMPDTTKVAQRTKTDRCIAYDSLYQREA
jgi:hypothetical protein